MFYKKYLAALSYVLGSWSENVIRSWVTALLRFQTKYYFLVLGRYQHSSLFTTTPVLYVCSCNCSLLRIGPRIGILFKLEKMSHMSCQLMCHPLNAGQTKKRRGTTWPWCLRRISRNNILSAYKHWYVNYMPTLICTLCTYIDMYIMYLHWYVHYVPTLICTLCTYLHWYVHYVPTLICTLCTYIDMYIMYIDMYIMYLHWYVHYVPTLICTLCILICTLIE
jgi:hypothetical protein